MAKIVRVKSGIGGRISEFGLGETVRTPSGLIGKVIGIAEFRSGWEYRIKVPGRTRTLYRKESKLTKVVK